MSDQETEVVESTIEEGSSQEAPDTSTTEDGEIDPIVAEILAEDGVKRVSQKLAVPIGEEQAEGKDYVSQESPSKPESEEEAAEEPEQVQPGARYDKERQIFIYPREDGNTTEVTLADLRYNEANKAVFKTWHDDVFKPAYDYAEGRNPNGQEQAVMAFAAKIGAKNPYDVAKVLSQDLKPVDYNAETKAELLRLGYEESQLVDMEDADVVDRRDLLAAQHEADRKVAKREKEIVEQRSLSSEREERRMSAEKEQSSLIGKNLDELTRTAPLKGTGLQDTPDTREFIRLAIIQGLMDKKSEKAAQMYAVNKLSATISAHAVKAAMSGPKTKTKSMAGQGAGVSRTGSDDELPSGVELEDPDVIARILAM